MGIELVDTHTHLNDAKFQDDVKETVERARAAGVTRMINMGDTLASSESAVNLAEDYDGLYAGVGIHPEEAFEMTSREDDILAGWTDMPKVVAIGEIGLDYYWEKNAERRELQRRIFIRQLALARELHMPSASTTATPTATRSPSSRKRARASAASCIATQAAMRWPESLIKMGWYIGVDGPLTFKNAAKLPEIVKAVPMERLLVETDAPYMAPVPMRGKRNEPAYVRFVAEKVAELRGMTLEEVAVRTTENAVQLYGL